MRRKRDHDSNMPVGKLTPVEDFLPPPHELAASENTVKITIALNKSSIEFFKKEAVKNHTKYQRMIREVLDWYASKYNDKAA